MHFPRRSRTACVAFREFTGKVFISTPEVTVTQPLGPGLVFEVSTGKNSYVNVNKFGTRATPEHGFVRHWW